MRKLIFDISLSGHHLEYISYIWKWAIEKKDDKFIFAVPGKEWNESQFNKNWIETDNIEIFPLDIEQIKKIKEGNKIIQSYKQSRLVAKIAKKVNADEVIMITLASVIPFLPFFLPKTTKVSGIIYQIFLYGPKKGMKYVVDYLRYFIMAKNRNVKSVFILNDLLSANNLNEKFKTDRFKCLPDPVPSLPEKPLTCLRERLGIESDSKVFLHFGAMDKRKGTLDILKAILCLDETDGVAFIFAGKINEKIKSEFDSLYKEIKEKGIKIIVMDEFCSYDTLHKLCYSSDCILMPYRLTNLSSGVIGYASLHRIPVIGPSEGLIGRLIKENKLGKTIRRITPTVISNEIKNFKPYSIGNKYAIKNNIDSFLSLIFQ